MPISTLQTKNLFVIRKKNMYIPTHMEFNSSVELFEISYAETDNEF
jgi:hypothetical protein